MQRQLETSTGDSRLFWDAYSAPGALTPATVAEVTWQDVRVRLAADSDDFPDPDRVFDATAQASPVTTKQSETLRVVASVLDGAGEMVDSILHIGPARTVPTRDIDEQWAEQHAPYLVRLLHNEELVTDVNEWLAKFEVPYTVSITRYGETDKGESFALKLNHVGPEGESVDLLDVGFGVSQILPNVVQLLGSREKTILIEEPEAHLHPRLQSVLGDLLVTSSQDYGNVVVAESHSEPLLLRIQRRVAEGRLEHEEVQVIHVVRGPTGSTIEDVPVLENGQLDYQWPGGFFDDRMDDLVAILDPQPEE